MNDENGNNIFNEGPNSLNEMAVGMHETFLSFKNAGFTEAQAMEIVLETIKTAMIMNSGDD